MITAGLMAHEPHGGSEPVVAHEGESERSRTPPRILLVDDDKDILNVLKIGLERRGFSVDGFTDPMMALDRLHSESYSVVIFDIMMPKMSGIDLYRTFRAIDRNTPVVFLTAFETYDADSLNDGEGVRHVLRKPITISDLVKALRKIVEQS